MGALVWFWLIPQANRGARQWKRSPGFYRSAAPEGPVQPLIWLYLPSRFCHLHRCPQPPGGCWSLPPWALWPPGRSSGGSVWRPKQRTAQLSERLHVVMCLTIQTRFKCFTSAPLFRWIHSCPGPGPWTPSPHRKRLYPSDPLVQRTTCIGTFLGLKDKSMINKREY